MDMLFCLYEQLFFTWLFGCNGWEEGELVDILNRASEMMMNFDSCELYVVGINVEEPNKVFITEIWK